jgi:hypothetical protein
LSQPEASFATSLAATRRSATLIFRRCLYNNSTKGVTTGYNTAKLPNRFATEASCLLAAASPLLFSTKLPQIKAVQFSRRAELSPTNKTHRDCQLWSEHFYFLFLVFGNHSCDDPRRLVRRVNKFSS